MSIIIIFAAPPEAAADVPRSPAAADNDGKCELICRNVEINGGWEVMFRDNKIMYKPQGWSNNEKEFFTFAYYDTHLPRNIKESVVEFMTAVGANKSVPKTKAADANK